MANLNKCLFIGNLTRDPEQRQGNGGGTICNFGLAVNHKHKENETVEFVNCVAFGKVADILVEHARKGGSLYVEGRMQTRSWDDKDGNKKYKTEIVVNEFQFLGSKPKDGGSAPF